MKSRRSIPGFVRKTVRSRSIPLKRYAYAAILEMLPEYRSEEICIHILYYHVTEKSRTEFRTNFTESELLQYFNGLVDEYIKWFPGEANRRNLLQQELCALKFPFPSYRRGQRELAVSVYKTITKNSASNIYVNAPTGIGKTISVLFPVLKAMCAAESGAEIKKIFYLTATNAGPDHRRRPRLCSGISFRSCSRSR